MSGREIGHDGPREAGDKHGLSLFSELEDVLVITPEHTNDYIQFGLGALSWTSSDHNKSAPAYCRTDVWHPPTGPVCKLAGLIEEVTAVGSVIHYLWVYANSGAPK